MCDDLIQDFQNQKGVPFEPRKYLMNAIMNNITMFLLGRKFTKYDTLFKEFLDIEHLGMELFSGAGKHTLIDVFPWLRYFGNETPKLMEYLTKRVRDLFERMKEEVVSAGDRGIIPILAEFQQLLTEGNVVGGEKRIKLACTNLIYAGSGTSTSTLHALLNVLTHSPDILRKLQVFPYVMYGHPQNI